MTTAQLTDYVTHSEFKDFAHKSELAHEKISGEISDLRMDIGVQNTKIDAQNVKIDAFTDKIDAQNVKIDAITDKIDAQNDKIDAITEKVSADIKLLGKELEVTLHKSVIHHTLWLVGTLLATIGLFWFNR